MKIAFKVKIILVLFACFVSAYLASYRHTGASACINADEAAFGYNAYSILKTGRDEYGTLLPIRLKSFGDYKLPLYSYLSVPFIQVFGLTEQGARSANVLVALLFPIAVYLLTKELFKDDASALIASMLGAVSLGLHIISRQAHEAYLSAFLITLTTYCFIKLLRHSTGRQLIPFLIVLFLALLSYQSSRLFAFFYLGVLMVRTLLQKADKRILFAAIIAIALFLLPDLIYKPARVGNLLFFNNAGLGMKTHELRIEGGNILLYNKATVAARDLISSHLQYYSPQFLISRGDENYRFGFPDMSPVTAAEYLIALFGIYMMFKTRSKHRYLFGGLLLLAPLAGSLSWAGASLSRTLFLIVLVSIAAGYGLRHTNKFVIPLFIAAEMFLLVYGWDLYLHHYPKRDIVIRSQQCGYQELYDVIRKKYDSVNTIYITSKHGQPYIFQLFFGSVNPASYQRSATLSKPDKYGFGQVLGYDKFRFDFPANPPKNALVVGYPDDYTANPSYESLQGDVQKITIGTQEIFWILQTGK